MSVESHDIHQENAGAYLLSALTEIEERSFERHLDECPVCRDEVERLRPAAAALPRSVTPVTPPASLKHSLMSAVEEDVRAAAAAAAAPAKRRAGPTLRQRLAGIGEALGDMRPRVALVGVSIVLLVGIVAGYAADNIGSGPDARTLSAKIDKRKAPFGTASLVLPGRAENGAILSVHGMPALDSNKTYQVWVQRKGEIVPLSLFTVGGNGEGSTAVAENMKGVDQVMVTREPSGGARAPSEGPLVRVAL